jgi:hypothetical protein
MRFAFPPYGPVSFLVYDYFTAAIHGPSAHP